MNYRLFITMMLLALGCSLALISCKDDGGGSGGDSDSDTDTDTDTDTDSDTDADTDTSEPTLCEPNETDACDCDSGVIGVSRCAPDGSAWTDCECAVYGQHLFIEPGATGGDGTVDSPYGTLTEARDAVRTIIAEGLPADGVAIWLRGGVYELSETLTLTDGDAGGEGTPVAWRGYPGESVRVTGGVNLEGDDFTPVTSSSPVWDRLDGDARDHIVQIDLSAAGITDYGTLTRRGFCGQSGTSPLELVFNGNPMTLARWPDMDSGVPDVDPTGDTIEVFGTVTPNVTGTYTRIGENDDVSVFQRDGLVGGDQFYLYRHHWEFDGSWHRAWFLTTDQSGYPTSNGPWWSLYNTDPGSMNPSNGATGNPLFLEPGAIRSGFAYINTAISDTEWTYAGNRPDRWAQASDVWFHGWWEHAWADCRIAAANVNTATQTVTNADENGYGISAGQPYYAFNLLEEITTPGEYFIDRDTGILYFYPPGEPADAEITVSMLDDYLFELADTHHVEVRDIIFEAGRSHLVRINGGNDNVLDGVILRNSGGRGASIEGTRNGIRNCVIHGTATGGVELSGGDRASLTAGENFVENCNIHHFGRIEWLYRPGVRLADVGHRAVNNRIHHAPHSAILYGGNEHRIALNEIHDVCEYSSDAGAVYGGRDWGARGNAIENNFIHHIFTKLDGYGVHGIYLDDCLSGIAVFGNILYEVQDHAIQHGGGRDNLMDNNLMVNCGDAISADSRGFDWRPGGGPNNTPGDSWNLLEKLNNVGYQAEPWASAYPECAAIPNDWDALIADGATWTYPEGCTFNRNLGFNNQSWMNGGDSFDHYASVANNVEDADPLFVDEANLDMTLSPDSPALAIPGFVNIPFSDIGIQTP